MKIARAERHTADFDTVEGPARAQPELCDQPGKGTRLRVFGAKDRGIRSVTQSSSGLAPYCQNSGYQVVWTYGAGVVEGGTRYLLSTSVITLVKAGAAPADEPSVVGPKVTTTTYCGSSAGAIPATEMM